MTDHYSAQREADDIWKNAPEGATHYSKGRYWMYSSFGFVSVWAWYNKSINRWESSPESPVNYSDYQERPQSTKPDWSKAPAEATHYADGSFLQKTEWTGNSFLRYNEQTGFWNSKLSGNVECYPDYQERPKNHTKPHQSAQDAINKYSREIIGLDGKACQVDVYRVLDAFEVDSHAIAHAIKKLLAPGKRHAKTREQDLKEAIKSIEAELLLMSQR